MYANLLEKNLNDTLNNNNNDIELNTSNIAEN